MTSCPPATRIRAMAAAAMDMSWLTGKSPASREWERGETGTTGKLDQAEDD